MIRNNERGFTLIEILVVMIIIGVLVSIIAGNFVGTRIKARDSRRKNDVTQVQRALEAYYNDHGKYPIASSGKMTNDTTPTPTVLDWGTNSLVDAKGTIYMVTLPLDPSAPKITYYYVTNAAGTKYQVFGYLENAQDSAIVPALASFPNVCVVSGSVKCNWGVSSPNAKVTDASL